MTFDALGIQPDLIKGLHAQNITSPTPIQEQAIPVLLQGRDASVSSPTGTGKTLAFLLPLFQRIHTEEKTIQAMVLAATHELAMQIVQEARELARTSGRQVRIQPLIGGVAIKRQLEGLKKKPHLIIGSTGRIQHLIGLKKINPHTIITTVVDEADRLLCSESAGPVQQLISQTAHQGNRVFVSATIQPESRKIIQDIAPKLVKVHVGANTVCASIEHQYIMCEERDKVDILRKLMHALKPERALAFVHTNNNAEQMARKLQYHKLPAASIHKDCGKLDRQKTLALFKKGSIRVLLASDIAARGLDIRAITHVVNVDIPSNPKDYLHRTGRTGRAGAKGQAISLVTPRDARMMERFTKELGITLSPVKLVQGRVVPDSKHG